MHFSIIIMATPLQSAVEARLKGGKAKPRELNLDSVRLTSGEFFFFCVLLFWRRQSPYFCFPSTVAGLDAALTQTLSGLRTLSLNGTGISSFEGLPHLPNLRKVPVVCALVCVALKRPQPL